MAPLIITLILIIIAMASPKGAGVLIVACLLIGLIVKVLTGVLEKEVTLLQSIKAVFFSSILMLVALIFTVQVIAPIGDGNLFGFGIYSVISFFLILIFSSIAFSYSLDLTARSSAILSVVFWGIAYPVLMYSGLAVLA